MSTVAYPVQQDSNGKGCTAPTLRQIVKSKWESTGIITGLKVTGTTSLTYSVSAGVAVCSKGTADGYTEAYFEGGSTSAVSAGDASNPRIDTIWITSHDITLGDADNSVVIGVTSGTPAASPAKPTIPTYATELASMLVPSGASSTASATAAGSVQYAIPYGASLGVLINNLYAFDGVGDVSLTWWTLGSGTVYLPTDRDIEFRFSHCISSTDGNNLGSELVQFMVDGVPFVGTEICGSMFWETHQFSAIKTVSAGTHTFSVRQQHKSGGNIYYHYAPGDWSGSCNYCGATFTVIDRGVSK